MELNTNTLKSETVKKLKILNEEMIEIFENWDATILDEFDINTHNQQKINEIEKLAKILVEKLENENENMIFVHQWSDNNTIVSFAGKLKGVGEVDNSWSCNATSGTQQGGFEIGLDFDTNFNEYIQNLEDIQ